MKTQDIAKKIKKNSRDSVINFRTITRIKESKKIYNRNKEKKIE